MSVKDYFKINDNYIFKPRDPISAISHFIGFILAIIATPILLIKAAYNNSNLISLISLSIYMLTMIILYGASSSYHSFNISKTFNRILKKIDHISVFLLIAGTYTPICLILLKDKIGMRLLIAIWSIAILGIIFKLFFVYCPKYISSIIYLMMGWLCIFVFPELFKLLPLKAFLLLLIGGLFYSIGAIIYALKPKILNNEYFTNHELFHIFVLLGSIMHYLFIFCYLTI